MKLKCVNYEIFWKNVIFAKNCLFQAWKYTYFDTYFHPLRNIVLKLFDDKCKAKTCEILT